MKEKRKIVAVSSGAKRPKLNCAKPGNVTTESCFAKNGGDEVFDFKKFIEGKGGKVLDRIKQDNENSFVRAIDMCYGKNWNVCLGTSVMKPKDKEEPDLYNTVLEIKDPSDDAKVYCVYYSDWLPTMGDPVQHPVADLDGSLVVPKQAVSILGKLVESRFFEQNTSGCPFDSIGVKSKTWTFKGNHNPVPNTKEV